MKKGDKIYKAGITLEVVGVKGSWVAFLVQNGNEQRIRTVKMQKFPAVKKVA